MWLRLATLATLSCSRCFTGTLSSHAHGVLTLSTHGDCFVSELRQLRPGQIAIARGTAAVGMLSRREVSSGRIVGCTSEVLEDDVEIPSQPHRIVVWQSQVFARTPPRHNWQALIDNTLDCAPSDWSLLKAQR